MDFGPCLELKVNTGASFDGNPPRLATRDICVHIVSNHFSGGVLSVRASKSTVFCETTVGMLLAGVNSVGMGCDDRSHRTSGMLIPDIDSSRNHFAISASKSVIKYPPRVRSLASLAASMVARILLNCHSVIMSVCPVDPLSASPIHSRGLLNNHIRSLSQKSTIVKKPP